MIVKWVPALLFALALNFPQAGAICLADLASIPAGPKPSEIARRNGMVSLAVPVALDNFIGNHQGSQNKLIRGLYVGGEKHDVNHLYPVMKERFVRLADDPFFRNTKMVFVFKPEVLDLGDWWVAKGNLLRVNRVQALSPADSISSEAELDALFAGELSTAAMVLGYSIPVDMLIGVMLPEQIGQIKNALAVRLKMMGIEKPIIVSDDIESVTKFLGN